MVALYDAVGRDRHLRALALCFCFCVGFAPATLAQSISQYLGQPKTGCGDGTEIKKYGEVDAPPGKHLISFGFNPVEPIENHASSAGQVGCVVTGQFFSSSHYLVRATLLAHADCGHSGGPTISAYCKATADLEDDPDQ